MIMRLMPHAWLLIFLLLQGGRGALAQTVLEPLPLKFDSTGVLFRVKAPDAFTVHLAGTFNGWGGSDGSSISDPSSKMYGPDDEGIFEIFYSLTPGRHIFKYCVDNKEWFPGPADLPRAKDDFDTTEGQKGMMGSMFEFHLKEPSWPSYIPTREMLPIAGTDPETGKPLLRIRFFSRADAAHVVGSFDGWSGIGSRAVHSDWHAMKPAIGANGQPVPNIWEKVIGPLKEGPLEYKIVVNNRMWLSDPTVIEQSQDGNTMLTVARHGDRYIAVYRPRFHPDAERRDTAKRWGNNLDWADDQNNAFLRASALKNKMIWVITLPKSTLSEEMMVRLNQDPEMVERLKGFICLETPANEVERILREQGIFRMPHVILVDSNYKPVYGAFNPSAEELKAALDKLP